MVYVEKGKSNVFGALHDNPGNAEAVRVYLLNSQNGVPTRHTTLPDDERIHNADSFSSSGSESHQRYEFKRCISGLRLHISLFIIIIGIVIVTSASFLFNFGSTSSEEETNRTKNTSISLRLDTESQLNIASVEDFELLKSAQSQYKDMSIPMKPYIENELKIASAEDFKLLKPSHSSIIIWALNEKYDANLASLIPTRENVQSIQISGPISLQWLNLIAQKFSVADSMTVDMDECCSKVTSLQHFNNNNNAIIVFENVKKLSVRNLKSTTNVSEFLQSLYLPKIKNFVVEDSCLSLEAFQVLRKFLEQHAKLFHSVTFQRCFICKECKVFDIEYSSNSEIEIFNRRTKSCF